MIFCRSVVRFAVAAGLVTATPLAAQDANAPQAEVFAGMSDAETRETANLLKEINRDRTIVVVEHDMTFVRELGVKVTCLHEGSVLAEGTLDQVSHNRRVVEVYLGR